jgi:hypothetical protein
VMTLKAAARLLSPGGRIIISRNDWPSTGFHAVFSR